MPTLRTTKPDKAPSPAVELHSHVAAASLPQEGVLTDLRETGADTSRNGPMVSAGLIAVVLAYLPVFLMAGLGIYVRETLSLSLVWIGIGTALFFAISAVSAATVGWLCGHFGGVVVLKLGTSMSAAALLLMAVGGWSIALFSAGLLLGGAANGLSQTAANVVLYEHIPHQSQGRVFAIKQSAAPTVTLVAGVGISVLIPILEWQGTFVLVAVLSYAAALISWAKMPHVVETVGMVEAPKRFQLRHAPGVSTLALVSFLSFAAATAAVAYYVETLAGADVEMSLAGNLLMVGSLAAILTRLLVGVLLDRLDLPPLLVCMAMMAVGSLGFLLVPEARSLLGLAPATILAFGAGWGWPGLFVLGVVRSFPDAAAWASGMVQLGSGLGAAAGPFAFGFASASAGFRAAWWWSALVLAASAATLHVWRRTSPAPAPRLP